MCDMALRKAKKRRKFFPKSGKGARIAEMRSAFDPAKIRAARKASNMRQEDLAKAIGCGREHISNIERGHGGCSFGLGKKIAQTLGLPVEHLYRGQPPEAAADPGERQILEVVRQLTPEARAKAYYFVLGLIASGGASQTAAQAALLRTRQADAESRGSRR